MQDPSQSDHPAGKPGRPTAEADRASAKPAASIGGQGALPSASVDGLLALMRRLRDPNGGCPWDRAQDFASIAPFTIEEAYEVADAIAKGAMDALREELGDLLFQVVFHSQMAAERGAFDFHDVVAGLVEKMTRRHPHVFGGRAAAPGDGQHAAWESMKAEERARKAAARQTEPPSALDGVPLSLPALLRAAKLQKRAAREGFDWPDASGVRQKIAEELAELAAAVASKDRAQQQEEFGDLLFACVNLGRHLGLDAENALRQANDKFERRFKAMEAMLDKDGAAMADMPAARLDALWQAAKKAEKPL
ncbi:MAG: nucleoside triphosphate pyrophosphohydrolase [Alphaproteobacteria bacterium]|nr:MAG: nucleoside triphosphate pyrophosphohydrolase [Alphaproteobacteria bacterium]